MSSTRMSPTICASAGLLMTRSTVPTTEFTAGSASGEVPEIPLNRAKTCQLVTHEGWPTLTFSTEDGQCVRWQLTHEQLRGVVIGGVSLI